MNKPQLPVQQYVPEQTIQHYLDALLQDAADELARADAEVAAPAPAPVVTEAPRAAVVHKLERPVEIAEPQMPAEPMIEPPAAPPPVQQAIAAWREEPFEALLFDVGGMKLAVPLVLLGSIYPLEGEITPLFGQPDWFLGILSTPAGNLKVLDTARWVMPERYTSGLQDTLSFVISVEGYDWGMAVHSPQPGAGQVAFAAGQAALAGRDGDRTHVCIAGCLGFGRADCRQWRCGW